MSSVSGYRDMMEEFYKKGNEASFIAFKLAVSTPSLPNFQSPVDCFVDQQVYYHCSWK